MPSLFITAGPRQGRSFELDTPTCEIGRLDCTITLEDDTISRRHARITRAGDGYEIHDLKSTTGTFVNGSRVEWARLNDGDQIIIGRCQLIFRVGPNGEGLEDDDCYTLEPYSADGMEEAVTQAWDPMRAQANLGALYRIGYAIGSVLEPRDLVQRALAIIVSEVKRIDFCSIHIRDETSGELQCLGQKSREGLGLAEAPSFSAALLDRVITNMQSVLSFDTQSDERLKDDTRTDKSPIRSALCVPLKNGMRLVGVLQAYTLSEDNRLTREDLELLSAVGQLVGAAVENALLYDHLKKEKARLEEANDKLVTAHEKLVQSEKLSAVGQLAAGIIHDIKNPMAVILGHAQGLKYLIDHGRAAEITTESLAASLGEIEQGVMHCNAIITDLLQFARHSTPAMMPTPVGELIQNTLKFLSYEIIKTKTKVELDIAADLPAAMVDEHQIKQVLINIIINAIQAMGEDGSLKIGARRADHRGKDHVFISVTDAGPGMTDEVKRRIFDPFFSTKKMGDGMGGTGLGLSVSYGIIEAHGGEIDVQSEVGKGTTFTLRLPVVAALL